MGNRTLIQIRCLILTDSCYQVVKYKKVEFDSLKKGEKHDFRQS